MSLQKSRFYTKKKNKIVKKKKKTGKIVLRKSDSMMLILITDRPFLPSFNFEKLLWDVLLSVSQ